MGTSRRGLGLILLAALSGSAWAAPPGERWLDPDATVRRTILCEPTGTDLPGDDVGVVTFYTGGLAAPDGKDVRVFALATETRPVPHRVVMQGPGDRLRVAFATPKGVRTYHVYYGNPKASAPAEMLDIRRGVLYEVRTGAAADAGDVGQVERAFDRGEPQGAAFVDNIFFGFNPFGPSEGYISKFTGWLKVEKPGEYRIATTSDDCSFVLIDDKVVVQWAGVHGAVADARHNGPVMLRSGLHKLVYWHAQGGGDCVAEAAWLPPGEQRFVVIPKEAFAPVAFAELKDIQVKGQRLTADFHAEPAGESFHDDFYPVRMAFKNHTSPGDASGVEYRWDFGDGQTSTDKDPDHVYLRHGTYEVRLTATWGPQRAETGNRVVVERDWWMQALNRMEPLKGYALHVSRYDFRKLDATSLGHAADLFARTGDDAQRGRALEALVFTAADVPEKEMLDRATELAGLCLATNRAADAVAAYRRAETQCGSKGRKAMAATRAGRVLADSLNRLAEADKEFRRVVADYPGAPKDVLRDAHIGVGDVACKRGDTEAALAAFRQAEAIPVGGLASRNPPLRVSSLARYVEEYIRTRDFETAEEFVAAWYREFPSERITGHAPLLEARLRFAQGRHEDVVRVAGELVGVNRNSPFAADLLFLAAEAALKLDRRIDARRALAQIVDDYPESPRHAEAGDLLRKLGGPPPAPQGP